VTHHAAVLCAPHSPDKCRAGHSVLINSNPHERICGLPETVSGHRLGSRQMPSQAWAFPWHALTTGDHTLRDTLDTRNPRHFITSTI